MRVSLILFSFLLLNITSCRKDATVLKSVPASYKQNLKTENVIVLVIDGPRFTETWGDPKKQYIPNLSGFFAKNGVVYENFRNNGPTYTLAGHTAISTGIYQEINNGGNELPQNRSIFQAYLKATGKPSEDAWIISSKAKIDVLGNCQDKNWSNKYLPRTDCGIAGEAREDDQTMANALSIFSKHHPKLSLVQLREPDNSGHANNWDGYLNGIRNSDRLAKQLWDFIEQDSIYSGKTTLFITNDHGRHNKGHLDGFVSHGDNCSGCRKIFLIAIGPDFKKNTILTNEGEQVDIPATISSMLQIQGFRSQGKVLEELFN